MSVRNEKTVTVKKIRRRMTAFYTLAILALFFSGVFFAFKGHYELLSSELSERIADLDIRLSAAADAFAASAEADCTKAFMSKAVEYDPIANSYEEYEKTALHNETKSLLMDISAGKSYNDFMIIFSDSSSVGSVSSGASEILSALGYDYFSDKLGDSPDAWLFGVNDSFGKVYYIRAFSDHSIFLLSCYTEDLSSALSLERGSDSDTFILADEEDRIIASSSAKINSGNDMPDVYLSLFNNKNGECAVKNGYVGASVIADNGWRAVTVTEMPVLSLSAPMLVAAFVSTTVVLLVLSFAIGFFSSAKYAALTVADPNKEFIDPMTGALNEYGLDEMISEMLETMIVGSTCAMTIIGVKDAAQLKQSFSPRYWNAIRKKMIETAEDYFRGYKFHIGRIHEDQIVIFVDYSEFDIFKAHEKLKAGCEGLCKAFMNLTAGENDDVRLHVSVGACIYPDHADDFDALIENAELAFKEAENASGDSCVIYDPSKHKQ